MIPLFVLGANLYSKGMNVRNRMNAANAYNDTQDVFRRMNELNGTQSTMDQNFDWGTPRFYQNFNINGEK